jgi:hypothetical protein
MLIVVGPQISGLNKESRGFLTPDEFNKIGSQVQLDILEKNFYDYNRAVVKSNLNRYVSEYGDIPSNIKEKIDILSKEVDLLMYGVNGIKFGTNVRVRTTSTGVSVPTQVTAGTYSNLVTTSNGGGTGLKVTVVATANNFVSITVVEAGSGYAAGDIVTIAQALMTGANNPYTFPIESTDLVNGNFILPTDIYKIINLSRSNRSVNFDEINKSEFTYVNSSKLTAPSKTYPIYYRDHQSIRVSPITLVGENITFDYIKTPTEPIWSGTTDAYGAITYAAGSSTDFDLHISDRVQLIIGILKYAGVVINDPQIIQAASAEANSQVQTYNKWD